MSANNSIHSPEKPSIPFTVITSPEDLNSAVRRLRDHDSIAVDTEANSRHRYPEQLCLIQLATTDEVFIIDPIVLSDLSPLRDIFSDPSITKVLHTAEYDIRSLDRHLEYHFKEIFDIAIAAQFIGFSKIGLANIVEEVLGLTIEKSKRLQTADWGQRPLSTEALEYASDDVRYLLELKEILSDRLERTGRLEWVNEEHKRIERIRYEARNPENAYIYVKKSNKLNGKALAVLKQLYLFREKAALRLKKPPHYIFPDSTLVYLADNPDADLSQTPGIGRFGLQKYGRALKETLRAAISAPPIYRSDLSGSDRPAIFLDPNQTQLLKSLKAWRASVAALLSLDASLVWPTASLQRLAVDPGSLEAELISGDVRAWQRTEFTSSLIILLDSLNRQTAPRKKKR